MKNPLQSICPYFAMFPESFVETQVLAYSRPGDLIFDPFSGRGTTVLQGLLMDRDAIGVDINPVAACVSGAKARVPALEELWSRIDELEACHDPGAEPAEEDEFFRHCFHRKTLGELLFLRKRLRWRDNEVDRFLAATLLGCLHGESHRTALCLSNRMPRTISTKPDYSVRWWKTRALAPPERSCFTVLRKLIGFRLSGRLPKRRGVVHLADARLSGELFRAHEGKVALIVTSPPYLNTTDYAEDQWLRLWFLGGSKRPQSKLFRDDRHRNEDQYWQFLHEVWAGCASLLRDDATIVVRIGGSALTKESLQAGLTDCLRRAVPNRLVKAVGEGTTTPIRRRQTNSFRPGTASNPVEHDFAFIVN